MDSIPQYHIVYETTNTVNGRIYVGVHSTDDLNDGYLGSGKAFKKALAKYGPDAFTRKIIEHCDSLEDAYDLESLIVDEEFIERRDNYNMKVGGIYGTINAEAKEKKRKSIKKALNRPEVKAKQKAGLARPEVKAKIRASLEKTNADPAIKKKRSDAVKKAQTPEVRAKLSAGVKRRYENPEYKKKIVDRLKEQWDDPEFRKNHKSRMQAIARNPKHRETYLKAISDPEVIARRNRKISEAWQRPETRENYLRARNDPETKKKMRIAWDKPEYKKKMSGYFKERWLDPEYRENIISQKRGRVWINNGMVQKFVHPNDIPDGFVRGRLPAERDEKTGKYIKK